MTAGATHLFGLDRRSFARLARLLMSCTLRCLLPEQALRPEHKDGDQDPEDDRPRPVSARREPREPLVEGLDEADRSAPSTAPARLPMPPSTAAVNAISPSSKPVS